MGRFVASGGQHPKPGAKSQWQSGLVAQSTITDKFQTTIPLEVRLALKLKPRQRVSYEVQGDGSAVIRPAPGLDELFGSLRPKAAAASSRKEKQAAREAIAREAAKEGLP
jgi:bifunctional DNA-binding transcriptional regulator/antitoxin component of YhaV-PrlF toxin-antitoxin module